MRSKFILLVLLQVAVLSGIIAYRQYWVATGERILLKTAPVDPRDLFRGDYVNLRYDISTIDLEKLGVKERFQERERVYVVLERNPDSTFDATSVSRVLPAGKRFIQGRVQYERAGSKWKVLLRDDSENLHPLTPQWFSNVKKGDRVSFCLDERGQVLNFFKEEAEYKPKCRGRSLNGIVEEIEKTESRILHVEYGIESYFVEEGKGRAVESSRGKEDLRVEVSLRKDGKGIITALFLGGRLVR
ncbi:MAG: GDYXXLXY domain-containing protein [Syntrophaceae bacterium]|nr:GDYXXLXY domain-containing protein [Syntrophaceae bacterium]